MTLAGLSATSTHGRRSGAPTASAVPVPLNSGVSQHHKSRPHGQVQPSQVQPQASQGSHLYKDRSNEVGLRSDNGRAAQTLAARIRVHLASVGLNLTLTDNRYTMLSVRHTEDAHGEKVFQVRLHHMFVNASLTIIQALALYIGQDDSNASRLLGEFIDTNQDQVRVKSPAKPAQDTTKGTCHDLQDIFDTLNAKYFASGIQATIRWGQRCGKSRRRNSIKMGSYSIEEQAIRIHRSLDRGYIPRFFVEWIVYHEMLHQVHKAPLVNGRRQFHTKEFLADEANFEHYALARVWEREHLDQLLTF